MFALLISILLFRFGFKWNSESTVAYILNLALVDFLACGSLLACHFLHYASGGWAFGEASCVATVFFNVGLLLTDWLTLALISASRCVNLVVVRGRAATAGGRESPACSSSSSVTAVALLWAVMTGCTIGAANVLPDVST